MRNSWMNISSRIIDNNLLKYINIDDKLLKAKINIKNINKY